MILNGLTAFGLRAGFPYWNAMIAESEAAQDRFDAAIRRLDTSLAAAETSGELYYSPELHRSKGAFLVARGFPGDRERAENCFRRAITLAQSQSAKTHELKAVISLARLLEQEGERQRAHSLLDALYRWFTEGSDTELLVEARTLLDRLDSDI